MSQRTEHQMMKVRPSQLKLDKRYQRDLDEQRARRIARKLDPAMLGVVVVSRRTDGTMVVIDGQHRTAALRMIGRDNPILCQVHDGLSIQEEADLFLRLQQNRSAVRPYDKYRARLTAKEPVAVEIDAIVRSSGFRVGKCSGANDIRAISALEASHRNANLGQVLGTVRAWSPVDMKTALHGDLLLGISIFLKANPATPTRELVKKLKRKGKEPEVMISQGRRLSPTFGSVAAGIAQHIAAQFSR